MESASVAAGAHRADDHAHEHHGPPEANQSSRIDRQTLGILLFIVTAVTFSIFFMVPKLGGASADDLASRYVGKSAGAAQIHETAVRLGFTDPIYVQYGRFVKGLIESGK